MKEQDKVICINDDFPFIKKYGGDEKGASIKPKKGDILIIDEILGDFLRFDLFDTPEQFNWWHKSRFRRIDDEELSCSAELEQLIELVTTNPL